MIKAIETRYAGYRFRSRLEARWAVFFDALGIGWEYEPEGFELPDGTRYLPDFKLDYGSYGEPQFWWAEVKGGGAHISPQEWAKMRAFAGAHDAPLLLLDGPPELRTYFQVNAVAGDDNDSLGCALFSYKMRPWWDDDANFFAHLGGFDEEGSRVLEDAVNAARGARFEHGESGARK